MRQLRPLQSVRCMCVSVTAISLTYSLYFGQHKGGFYFVLSGFSEAQICFSFLLKWSTNIVMTGTVAPAIVSPIPSSIAPFFCSPSIILSHAHTRSHTRLLISPKRLQCSSGRERGKTFLFTCLSPLTLTLAFTFRPLSRLLLLSITLPRVGDAHEAPAGFEWKGRGDKTFLYDIVANKRNGVDVDRFDYFKR